MAKTKQTIVVENGKTSYELDFPYLQTSDIVATGGHSYTITGSTINFTSPIDPGDEIDVIRVTDINEPLVEWQDATNLNPVDLDTTLLQPLYALQEIHNDSSEGGDSLQGQISANRDNISTNADDILTLEGQTSLNTARIATNEQDISDNSDGISSNAGSLLLNQIAIDSNTSELANHEGRISTNESAIEALEAGGGGDSAQVQANTANIADNAQRINANDSSIDNVNSRVDTTLIKVNNNTTAIQTNADAIEALGSDVRGTSNVRFGRIEGDPTARPLSLMGPMPALADNSGVFIDPLDPMDADGYIQLNSSNMSGKDNTVVSGNGPGAQVSFTYPGETDGGDFKKVRLDFANQGRYEIQLFTLFSDLPTMNSGMYLMGFKRGSTPAFDLAFGNIHPSQFNSSTGYQNFVSNGVGMNQPASDKVVVDIGSAPPAGTDWIELWLKGSPIYSSTWPSIQNDSIVAATDFSFVCEMVVTRIS